MLSVVRRVLNYQMTIAEWIGTALLILAPYLVIGLVWSLTHSDDLTRLSGLTKVARFLGAAVAWPVLLVAEIC